MNNKLRAVIILLSAILCSAAIANEKRLPEPLSAEERHEGEVVASWSYSFIPDEKIAFLNLEDSVGKIAYADENWIVKILEHPSKFAQKSQFDLYFYDSKTLRLVSAVRLPNVLEQIKLIPDQGVFAMTVNSPGKPHYMLGNIAVVLVEPRKRLIEKFDLSNDGWRDNLLSLSLSGSTLQILFDPEKSDQYKPISFASNVFPKIKISLRQHPSPNTNRRDSNNWTPWELSHSSRQHGAVDLKKSGTDFLRSFLSASDVNEDNQNLQEVSETSDIEYKKRLNSPISAGSVVTGEKLSGVNILARTRQNGIRLLNLNCLTNKLFPENTKSVKSLNIFEDGTVFAKSDEKIYLHGQEGKTTIDVLDGQAVLSRNQIHILPKNRNFAEFHPFEQSPDKRFAFPPFPIDLLARKISTDGRETKTRFIPQKIQKRFLSEEAKNPDAGWRYHWDFFPDTNEIAISEKLVGGNSIPYAVTYSVTNSEGEPTMPQFSVELGAAALSGIKMGNSSDEWRALALLTDVANIGPDYSILLWSQKNKRFILVEGNLAGLPGILHLNVTSQRNAQLLYSYGDTIKLIEFDPSEASAIPSGNVPSASPQGAPSIASKTIKEWVSPGVVLPAFFLQNNNLVFVPKIYGYEMYQVFVSPLPAKLCEVFLSGNEDYAVILPNGTYAGSPGCEVSVLHKAGQGAEVDAAALTPWRNRPAEVLKALNGDPAQIEILSKVTERWLKKLGNPERNPEPTAKDIPSLTLANDVPLWAEGEAVKLQFNAKPGTAPVKEVVVRVNGVDQQRGSNSIANKSSVERTVKLAEGQNWIEAVAIDEKGRSSNLIRFRTILSEAEKPTKRFIIAIGVSKYRDSTLNLEFAAKDATDLASAIKESTKGETEVLLLTDEQATKDATAKIREFLANATENDEVVAFCAGHGVLDSNLDYVYASHEFDSANPSETGIKLDELVDAIGSSMSLKRLLLLDTCHSGQVGEKDEMLLAQMNTELPKGVRAVKQRGMSVKPVAGLSAEGQQRFIEEMFLLPGIHRGINIIGASGGAEFALESAQWNNGVFTATIIEALRDKKADLNGDARISVGELRDFLGQRVSELTKGAQKPSVVAAERDQDFDLIRAAYKRVSNQSNTSNKAITQSDKILEFQVALAKANSGDAYAQAVVSIYYGLGIGCDQDFAKSKEYVMLSAKQQNPLGIYRLAEMRESGEGMDQNTDQANQLMQKAKPGLQKLANDPYAMTALAAIYERENPASPKVRQLLTKASDMGYEPAQTKLSQIQTNP
jgi:uncharacterized caspase-like protein